MRNVLLKAALALAATRLGGWFFTTVTPPLDRLLIRRTQGRWNIGFGWVPICLLTTIGRHSGRQYHTPLLFIQDTDFIYLIASAGGNPKHPAWYYNAKDRPVTLVVSGERIEATAREIPDRDYPVIWQKFVAFNPGFEAYKRRITRHIPIIRIPLN